MATKPTSRPSRISWRHEMNLSNATTNISKTFPMKPSSSSKTCYNSGPSKLKICPIKRVKTNESNIPWFARQRLTVEQALNHKWFKTLNIHDSKETPLANINLNNNNNNNEQFSLVESNQNEINQITTTITKSIHLHYENNNLQFDKTSTTILSTKIMRNPNLADHQNENEITSSTLTASSVLS